MARIASRWGLLVASFCAALTRAASAPPPIVPPDPVAGAVVRSVADDLVINGRRCRIDTVDWSDDMGAVIARYGSLFGARHVVRQVRGVTVIAGERDGAFETVQLRPNPQGGVSATVLATATDGVATRSAAAADAQRWLPPDTAVLQTLESRDDGRPSLLLSAANTFGLRANRDQLVAALQARGWRLDREDATTADGGRPGVLLSANSAAGEVIVSIGDAGAYRTVLIQRSGSER